MKDREKWNNEASDGFIQFLYEWKLLKLTMTQNLFAVKWVVRFISRRANGYAPHRTRQHTHKRWASGKINDSSAPSRKACFISCRIIKKMFSIYATSGARIRSSFAPKPPPPLLSCFHNEFYCSRVCRSSSLLAPFTPPSQHTSHTLMSNLWRGKTV